MLNIFYLLVLATFCLILGKPSPIEHLIQWIRGGRYELWYVDYPFHEEIWHYTTKPNERPSSICRGSVIKVREYKGFWIFKRK